jgi:hypothetical protein
MSRGSISMILKCVVMNRDSVCNFLYVIFLLNDIKQHGVLANFFFSCLYGGCNNSAIVTMTRIGHFVVIFDKINLYKVVQI